MITKEIFISSSISDLKDERETLNKAIKNISTDYLEFSPLMSEHFSQFHFTERSLQKHDSVEICLENVRKCDYYVLLIKNEYKYNKNYGCSVTELEYREAKLHNKPIFVFVFDSEKRKKTTYGFIKRVSNEKWRYQVSCADDVVNILKNICLKFNSSKFVSENLHDNITMRRGQKFIKTWTIKNSGSTIWSGYYMKHMTPSQSLIPQQELIEMPCVYPGDEYTLEMEYKCKYEGNCQSVWKMVDSKGNIIFPNYKGIYMNVQIIGE